MGLGPVDDANGVGGFVVIGIFDQDFLLPIAGVIKSLDAEINARDLFQTVYVMRVLGKNDLKTVDGLVGDLQVVGSVEAWYDVLRQGRA